MGLCGNLFWAGAVNVSVANTRGQSKVDLPPVEYLLGLSEISIQGFLLSQLNRSDLLRKEIRQLLEQWAEVYARVLLAQWLIENEGKLIEPPRKELPTT